MNRFRVWGLSAALAVGFGGSAMADPTPPGEQTTLVKKLSDLFTPKPPKQSSSAVRTGAVTIVAPLPPSLQAEAFRAEQEAYLRRLNVCTELRRAADERSDYALGRRADDLERQVTALYYARVSALGLPPVKAPPPGSPNKMGPDEPAPVKVAANRLTAPASPVPAGSTAQVREVMP